MTTMFVENFTCCICDTPSEHSVIGSTNAFGAADLDTRPPEMARSTIYQSVQRCPSCGYCAADLSKGDDGVSDIVATDNYQMILNQLELPDLANTFLAMSHISQQQQQFSTAAWQVIEAAWICDDEDNIDSAKKCREEALMLIEKGHSNKQFLSEQKGASEAISIDLFRRTGRFEEAFELVQKTKTMELEEILCQILEFEEELIRSGDIDVHTIDEVLVES